MADQGDDWEKYLDAAVFANNTSVQCTTKVTPFCMMFGREPRFPLEAEKAYEYSGPEEIMELLRKTDVERMFEKMVKKQETVFKGVHGRIQEAQKSRKSNTKAEGSC